MLSAAEILPFFIICQGVGSQLLNIIFPLIFFVTASKIGAGNVTVCIFFLAEITGIAFLLFTFKVNKTLIISSF